MYELIEKIKNNKNILFYALVSIIIIAIVVVLVLIFKKEDPPQIILIGNKEENVYQNETYNDPGYKVFNSDGSVYKGNVKVTNNVDVRQLGTYKIFYFIISDNKVIASAERTIKVIENPITDVTITLNGNPVEFVLKGGTYQEKGAKAFNKGVNITNSIIIEGSVNTFVVGQYSINYKIIIDGKEKKMTRIVKVIDLVITHSIDKTNKKINLYVNSEIFEYIILPNQEKAESKNITYAIDKNGVYKFIIYANEEIFKEYTVTVEGIIEEKPTASCQIIVDGSSTEFKITNPSDNITKYQYNGTDFYNANYKLGYEAKTTTLRLYASDTNYSDITCTKKRIFSNNMTDITASRTLTPCNNNWTTQNNELATMMQEAGLKTRTAVAIAADYLARFSYKVAYSWGGKSLSTGINPRWGCEAHVTKEICTKKTGTNECIYGMDCTGYTSWAFFQAGFSKDVLRTSSQSEGMWGNFSAHKHKYSFKGNQDKISQIKPGDIVWTEGHVGIVLGTSADLLKVANMHEGIQISYIKTSNGYSTNGDKNFTHFVLFDDFFDMYGSNT